MVVQLIQNLVWILLSGESLREELFSFLLESMDPLSYTGDLSEWY